MKRLLAALENLPVIDESDGRLQKSEGELSSSSAYFIVTKETVKAAATDPATSAAAIASLQRTMSRREFIQHALKRKDETKIEATYVQKLEVAIVDGEHAAHKRITPVVPHALEHVPNGDNSAKIVRANVTGFTSSPSSSILAATLESKKSVRKLVSCSPSPVTSPSYRPKSQINSMSDYSPMLSSRLDYSGAVEIDNVEDLFSHSLNVTKTVLAPLIEQGTMESEQSSSEHSIVSRNEIENWNSNPIFDPEGVSVNEIEGNRHSSMTFSFSKHVDVDYSPASVIKERHFELEQKADNTGDYLVSFTVDEYKYLLEQKVLDAEKAEFDRNLLESVNKIPSTNPHNGMSGVDEIHQRIWKPSDILAPYMPCQADVQEDHEQFVVRQGMLQSLASSMKPTPSIRIPPSILHRDEYVVIEDDDFSTWRGPSYVAHSQTAVPVHHTNNALAKGIEADALKRKQKFRHEMDHILEKHAKYLADSDDAATTISEEILEKTKLMSVTAAKSRLKHTLNPRRESFVPQPSEDTIAMMLSRGIGEGKRVGRGSRSGNSTSRSRQNSIVSHASSQRSNIPRSASPASMADAGTDHDESQHHQQAQSSPSPSVLLTDIEKSLSRASKLISFTLPALRYGVTLGSNKLLTSTNTAVGAPVLDRATITPHSRDLEIKNMDAFVLREEDEDDILRELEDIAEEEEDDESTVQGSERRYYDYLNQQLASMDLKTIENGNLAEFHADEASQSSSTVERDAFDDENDEVDRLFKHDAKDSLSRYLSAAMMTTGSVVTDRRKKYNFPFKGGRNSPPGPAIATLSTSPKAESPTSDGGDLVDPLGLADEFIEENAENMNDMSDASSPHSPESSRFSSRRNSLLLGNNSRRGSTFGGAPRSRKASVLGVTAGRRRSSVLSDRSQFSRSEGSILGQLAAKRNRDSFTSVASSLSGQQDGSQGSHVRQSEAVIQTPNKSPSRHEEVIQKATAGVTIPVIFVPKPSCYSNVTIDQTFDEINQGLLGVSALKFESESIDRKTRSRSPSPFDNNNSNNEGFSQLVRSPQASQVVSEGSTTSSLTLPPINLRMSLTTNKQSHLSRIAPVWQRSNSPTRDNIDTLAQLYSSKSHDFLQRSDEIESSSSFTSSFSPQYPNNQSMLMSSQFESNLRSSMMAGNHSEEMDKGDERSITNKFSKSLNNYDWGLHSFRAAESDTAELYALTKQIEEKIAKGSSFQVENRTESARNLLMKKVQTRTLAKGMA